MQIHELTRPRKVNEASVAGALSGVKAVAGGIGSALGKSLMTKALGTDVTSQAGPAQSREQGFQDMANSSAAKTLATSMQTAWQQTVQNFMANSKDASGNPPTSLSQVSQPSIATLKANLEDLVNKMIGRQGSNYKNMATVVGDPTQKSYAEKVTIDIDKFIDAIYNATLNDTDPKAMANLFTELVGKGVLIAQNLMAYDTGRGGFGGARSGAVGLTPQQQALADKLKFTDADILNGQQAAKDPAQAALLAQMFGLTK